MSSNRTQTIGMALALLGLAAGRASWAAAESGFALSQTVDRVVITCAGHPVATYVFRDDKIRRPYFANLHAPGGIQVTRQHPPVPDRDALDHDTMHPGVWLGFGDMSGHDFWRNKATVQHERFVEPVTVRDGELTFVTENRLQTADDQTLCRQTSRITLAVRPAGYLLIWEAAFQSHDREFVFGDQEEMGLGVRVATPLIEKNGGLVTASTGAQTAPATWGKAFDWCDYSGPIGDRRAGVTLMPDPANFRPSWFHNRDYGLMVANPFGRAAMKQGPTSRVAVKKGERFRLRFGVLLHSSPAEKEPDRAAAYRDFLDPLRR